MHNEDVQFCGVMKCENNNNRGAKKVLDQMGNQTKHQSIDKHPNKGLFSRAEGAPHIRN
jgi:hypothetical protein